MKRLIAAMLVLTLVFLFPLTVIAAAQPEAHAEAFVLYCVESQEIILSKNKDKRMKPASTTKLMTTLLTLEEAAKHDRVITFTPEMAAEGSSMYLAPGEQVRLSDLAAGMMMSSGNDAANAAAISLSGSLPKFANLMNARAKELGMAHTHFVTPSGLDDDAHYTTAYDLALLMAQGLENEAFADLTGQKSVAVRFVSPDNKMITYANHNRLLSLYKDCIGGKTGYTEAAGRCLVSAARRDGVTLVCVTLNDKSDWDDHIALYDYGFSQRSGYGSADSNVCIALPCVGGESDTVPVMGESDVHLVVEGDRAEEISRTVIMDSFVYAPVPKGERLGRIDYTLDGRLLGSTPLIAAQDVAVQGTEKHLKDRIKDFFTYG